MTELVAPAPAGEQAVQDKQANSEVGTEPSRSGFRVRLDNFEGPFDLLLQLISRHELDVTEVALHKVTDEFLAYTKEIEQQNSLDEITEFLVVAATLLDLKAARLLPNAEVEDEADLELLEARDLLFARLLQYKAYQQVAALFGQWEAGAARRYPRSVSLEDRFRGLLPQPQIGVSPQGFAEVAAAVFRPKPPPEVSLDHLHQHPVSVREHAGLLRIRLAELGQAPFAELILDCGRTVEIVARFLALLELYREAVIAFQQDEPMAPLVVTWVGGSLDEARQQAAQAHVSEDEEEYG